ncbi:hypothetical protein LCGC14_3104230, partial [marine sediment metagenome]
LTRMSRLARQRSLIRRLEDEEVVE